MVFYTGTGAFAAKQMVALYFHGLWRCPAWAGGAGLSGWRCPINETLGVICPGCGMTTAMAMLLQGHWHLAAQTHAFAPVILIVLMIMLIAIGLPASYLRKFSGSVQRLEQ